MNKAKKTTLWDRIRAAVRAFQGKPKNTLQLGLRVTRCDECDRGDCEQCVYKHKFEELMAAPQCNDCYHNSHSTRDWVFCPRPGEQVRINCPHWKPKKGDSKNATL